MFFILISATLRPSPLFQLYWGTAHWPPSQGRYQVVRRMVRSNAVVVAGAKLRYRKNSGLKDILLLINDNKELSEVSAKICP